MSLKRSVRLGQERSFVAMAATPPYTCPPLSFPAAAGPSPWTLLLYPHSHSGYVTRLFFRQALARGPNWQSHFVCGETWWAPSWNNVHPNQPWVSMLANHLKAVE